MPLITAFITLILSGLISFKFGPIWPFEPASASVWHAEQDPLFRKTFLPKSNIASDFAGIATKLKKIKKINEKKKFLYPWVKELIQILEIV